MTNLLPFLMLGLAYLALKVPASYQRPKFNWNTTKYVYAFGDSYTFVQGTAGLANFRFVYHLVYIIVIPMIQRFLALLGMQPSFPSLQSSCWPMKLFPRMYWSSYQLQAS